MIAQRISMSKNNHQKDVICFKKNIYNKMSDCQENEDETNGAPEKPIGDGLLITTVATATVEIFFSLRATGLVQHDALLAPTSLVWLMSLPV